MKNLGIGICIIGTIIAILFVPCEFFLGIEKGWRFILGESGFGIKNYEHINTSTLVLELILINGVGLALIFLGRNKK